MSNEAFFYFFAICFIIALAGTIYRIYRRATGRPVFFKFDDFNDPNSPTKTFLGSPSEFYKTGYSEDWNDYP